MKIYVEPEILILLFSEEVLTVSEGTGYTDIEIKF